MGKGYVFKDNKRDGAATKANKFSRDVAKTFNRRCSVVAIIQNQRDARWACTVDVCGQQDIRIDQIARKYE